MSPGVPPSAGITSASFCPQPELWCWALRGALPFSTACPWGEGLSRWEGRWVQAGRITPCFAVGGPGLISRWGRVLPLGGLVGCRVWALPTHWSNSRSSVGLAGEPWPPGGTWSCCCRCHREAPCCWVGRGWAGQHHPRRPAGGSAGLSCFLLRTAVCLVGKPVACAWVNSCEKIRVSLWGILPWLGN